MIAYVSIGNSDDKLSQREWSSFHGETDNLLRRFAMVHGAWTSLGTAPWQNACWCVEITDKTRVEYVKAELAGLANRFRQDSIAWAEAPTTEFIDGGKP